MFVLGTCLFILANQYKQRLLDLIGSYVEGDDLCMGSCINTPGSYKCQCPAGYEIQKDGRTCKGEIFFFNF